MNHDKLATFGFRAALMMHWVDGPGTFKVTPVNGDAETLRTRSVVYAWYDRHNDVVMNVGLTGQSLKARFMYKAGYEHWLNGALGDSRIRRAWLDHIKTSRPGLIEVHVRPCDPSVLRQEETRFMAALNPKLNVRR
jgi:hypothetical protein